MRLAYIDRSFILTSRNQDLYESPIRIAGIERDGPLALGHGCFHLSLKA